MAQGDRRQPAEAFGDAEALTDPLRVPPPPASVESAHAGVPGGETSAGTKMSGMQGRFRSEKVPQIEREVGDPAPPEVEIDGRTYRLVETIGSLQAGDFVALYDEIPPGRALEPSGSV